MLPFLIPLGIAAASTIGGIINSNNEANKQRRYEHALQKQKMQEERRQAIVNAIGARSNTIRNQVKAPDYTGNRIASALMGLAGNAAQGYLGSQTTPEAGSGAVPTSQLVDDPSEAIRRRLQGGYNPYSADGIA
jgi:hypothetical protein